jgi:glycosyltransferase involved in cell wall biosynthesis
MLITYNRTELAKRTIQGVLKNLIYPNLVWHIADDGSDIGHVNTLLELLSESGISASVTNAGRRGVGRSMNLGMNYCLEQGAEYILWLEDDWELTQEFDLRQCVSLLDDSPRDVGMVRLGYISPGIEGALISGAGRLWWQLHKGSTYTFTGHASLRSKQFCLAYGPYQEGLAPGETELYMCGTFNNKPGPNVVIPAFTGEWGVFGHIGSESLKDLKPVITTTN